MSWVVGSDGLEDKGSSLKSDSESKVSIGNSVGDFVGWSSDEDTVER